MKYCVSARQNAVILASADERWSNIMFKRNTK